MFVWHLQLAANDLEVKARWHHWLATAFEGRDTAAGSGNALVAAICMYHARLLSHALNHLGGIRHELFGRWGPLLIVHLYILVVLLEGLIFK